MIIYNSRSGIAYDTTKGNLNDLKDTDDAEPLMNELDTTKKAKDGLFRKYWSNGQLRYEWEYKDGERADGTSKSWWPNGKLKQTISWKDGKVDGLSTQWDENGQKEDECNYKNGKKDGLWTQWYDNGQKSLEVTYKNGKLKRRIYEFTE